MNIRRSLLLGAASAALLPAFVRAQAAWPSKPFRLVVPFPPGGTTDVLSRLVGVELTKAFGQSVVVDNRPGAGSVIGVDAVAKSPADGYTLVTVANSFAVNQTLVKKLPYDGLRDLRAVALLGVSEHVLVTFPGSGITKPADIVAAVRAGKRLSYASFGTGTSAHLAGEMLKMQLGVDIVHVPYKGQSPALNDVLGGQVTMMFGNWSELRPQVESGRLVVLGMATAKRSVYGPQIPTLAEQGVKVESSSWNGVLAPAGTPDAVVQRLNTEINKILASPPVLAALQKVGIASHPGTPAQFAGFIHSEIARYAEVIHRAHITAEG